MKAVFKCSLIIREFPSSLSCVFMAQTSAFLACVVRQLLLMGVVISKSWYFLNKWQSFFINVRWSKRKRVAINVFSPYLSHWFIHKPFHITGCNVSFWNRLSKDVKFCCFYHLCKDNSLLDWGCFYLSWIPNWWLM